MITSTLMGGLGNNLFQISTAFALSKESNQELMFGLNSVVYGHRPISNYFNNIMRKIKFVDNIENVESIYSEPFFHYNKIEPQKNLKIHGYFQSEKYFVKYKKELLELFEIDKDSKSIIYNKYGNILNKNTCSIHVRRGDYLGLPGFHPTCDIEYYMSAIKYFSFDTTFLVFSDDIEWCKKNFIGENFLFIENNENYIDLYLMSLCVNNIIGNSSFSWWGAWINKNKNKKVVTPKKWFGENYNHLITDDIYCKNWIKL